MTPKISSAVKTGHGRSRWSASHTHPFELFRKSRQMDRLDSAASATFLRGAWGWTHSTDLWWRCTTPRQAHAAALLPLACRPFPCRRFAARATLEPHM